MMKRLSSLLFASLLCFSLFAASGKPSLDGRAVVADIGELPIGLFAKSAAFLPGDTVVVTNPSTHISIEVMIFGGFDSSEGIAIILSPEAARELYISKGSDVIVQVTKKTDAWSENTILSKTVESYAPDEDPDRNQEIMIGDIEEPVFEKPGVVVEDVVFYVEEPILPPEEFVEVPVEEEIPEEVVVEEVVREEVIPEEIPEEITPAERTPLISRQYREQEAEVAEKSEDESETVEEITADEEKWALISDSTDNEDSVEEEELVEEEIEEELEEDSATLEDEEIICEEEPAYIPEATEEAEESDEFPDFIFASGEEESLEESEITEETEITEDIELPEDTEITEDTESLCGSDPDSLSDSEVADDSEEEYIVETEVILIPTEFYPPVADTVTEVLFETASEDAMVETTDELDEEAEEIIDESDSLADEPDIVIIIEDEEVIAEPELPAITVVSQNELPKGYYVQILTASKMTTVEDTVDMYGKNYPMQFAESARGGIQVLIGPLTPDEYAIIQARFRSYGYKDCFVRNIK